MNVHVHSSNFNLATGLRESIAWRVACAVVHRSDVKGRRGATDKRCAVESRRKADPSLAVAEAQTVHHVAIDRAFARARRRLHRWLARHDFAGAKP